jgi:hypothetical protein
VTVSGKSPEAAIEFLIECKNSTKPNAIRLAKTNTTHAI